MLIGKQNNLGGEESGSLFEKVLASIKDYAQNPVLALTELAVFAVIAVPSLLNDKSKPAFAGHIILYILMFYLLFYFICGHKSTGKKLRNGEAYLLSALTGLYFLQAVLIRDDAFYSGAMPISVAGPASLFIMLISIMVGKPHARIFAMLLPLGAFITGAYNLSAFIFALSSGIASSFVLKNPKKRIDMALAGFIVAAVNVITACALLLIFEAAPALYPLVLLAAALNGIAGGMFTLGITPLLETLLRSATAFRLIELLDLGAPMMRLMASKTPGTFSHSTVVANLAEAACIEIKARSLLARVGAYYHDIGKIDQPDYFVENQTISNKHDEINPRLSATVIRSHVRLGIEKGAAIGLPDEVIDIIASHHGNSLIAYFYNEALKKDENIEAEDFCYPGHPPRTKEAGVVMLSDVVEAAVRTLEQPSPARLEKFIDGIITKKVNSGQLSESELTFKELETIKKVFLRVLISHNHTRIEYPEQAKEAPKDDE